MGRGRGTGNGRNSSPKWRQGDVPQRNLRVGLAWRHRPISGSGDKKVAARGPSGEGCFDATLSLTILQKAGPPRRAAPLQGLANYYSSVSARCVSGKISDI